MSIKRVLNDVERASSADASGTHECHNRRFVSNSGHAAHVQRVRAQRARAVQRRASDGAAQSDGQVHEAAQQGVQGAATTLPHLDSIQASFGKHDVSGVAAHVGGYAKTASDSIGAEAYALGTHVAFGGQPNLHTAAHEAAHVVQQRGGVQLSGGVGQSGDRYEQHADQVADAVVAGQSAEGVLDEMASTTASSPERSISLGSVRKKEYTADANTELVALLFRRGAELANTYSDRYVGSNELSDEQQVQIQSACGVVAVQIEHAMHAVDQPGSASAQLPSLFSAADLALHGAVGLLGMVESDGKGATRLRASLRAMQEMLEPAGWKRAETVKDDKLSANDSTSLVRLSLEAAVHRIQAVNTSKGSGNEETDRQAMRRVAGHADKHLFDGLWAMKLKFGTALERRQFAPDIQALSDMTGDLQATATAAKVEPHTNFEKLFEHEDQLLALIGEEEKHRYIERAADVNAVANDLTDGVVGVGNTGEPTKRRSHETKEDAINTIATLVEHLFDAQGAGVINAENSTEEPAPPKKDSGWEFLAKIAFNFALSASAGAVGSLVKKYVSKQLKSHEWAFKDGNATGNGDAFTEAAKDGMKGLYKDTLKAALHTVDLPDIKGTDGVYTPRNVFFGGQKQILLNAKLAAITQFGPLRGDLRRYDKTSLEALVDVLRGVGADGNITDWYMDRALREWMNFKARINTEEPLDATSRRDAGLPSKDQLDGRSAPDGFLSVLVDVNRRLGPEPAMSVRSLSMGAEPSVLKHFKEERGTELVRNTKMNTLIQVAGTSAVIQWLPDSGTVSLKDAHDWTRAWLKALYSGDTYANATLELDARKVRELNEKYDDSAAIESAERLAVLVLDHPLSELEG